jgi:hypothetical protein
MGTPKLTPEELAAWRDLAKAAKRLRKAQAAAQKKRRRGRPAKETHHVP